MIRRLLHILISISFIALPIPSQAIVGVPDIINWQPAGFGGAGTYSVVAADRFIQNKVYAAPDVNAPYVSTNNGDLWQFLSKNNSEYSNYGISNTAYFHQSKSDGNILFAIDGDTSGMFRSSDGGTKWTKVSSFRGSKGQKYIDTVAGNSNIVFATTISNGTLQGGRVYQSTDGGVTFNELFRPFDISITGETAELNIPANSTNPNARTGTLNNLNNILKTSVVFTSSGETFTDVPGSSGTGTLVGSSGGTGSINYMTGAYTLRFASTPTSTTVSYVVSPSASFVGTNSQGTIVYAGRNGTAGKSLAKYEIATQTLTQITLSGTNAVANVDYDTYVDSSGVFNFCVTAGNKIACTPDDGTNWNYTTSITGGTSTTYINHFGIKRKASANEIHIVANRALLTDAAQTAQFYSHNTGGTWFSISATRNAVDDPTNAFTTGGGFGRTFSINADLLNEDVWYSSSDWRIFRSNNGGANWSEKVKGAQNTVTTDVAVSPNGRIFQTSMDTGIQYSDDSGSTWVQTVPNTSKGQTFVTGSINDYGGHYWRILTLGSKSDWDSGKGVVVASATMYGTNSAVYTKNFIVRSEDNGVTWSRTNTGLPDSPLFGETVWGNFFINGAGGFARSLGKSADESTLYVGMDGENCKLNPSLPYDGCSPTGTNHALGGLFASTDKGKTWKTVWNSPRKIYNAIAVDPTDPTGAKMLFGTFGYNMYQKTQISESAELNGSGQTRTGTINNKAGLFGPGWITFKSSSGEIFTETSAGVFASNMGGSGSLVYSTGDYSLTFGGTVASTTVTYNLRTYVGSSDGPSSTIYDAAYDSSGRPYAVTASGGPTLYRAETTVYSTKDNPLGGYGTWKFMKRFNTSSGILDGIYIDPENDNHIFVSSTLGSAQSRKIWVTNDAQNGTKATWYDITGNFPVVRGCQSLTINRSEGPRGALYCASNGGGLWKLDLTDSVEVLQGVVSIGE